MKSLTKSGPRAIPESQFQVSLPMQGVLRDVQHAFVGPCVHAGRQVLAAMMEADRAALCGPKGVPDATRRAVSHAANDQPEREPQRVGGALVAQRAAMEERFDDPALGGQCVERRQRAV